MALGAILGNLARSWRLLESVRSEKNIREELTIGPRSPETLQESSGMVFGMVGENGFGSEVSEGIGSS